ncbi:MerR family transcriptional regulator [Rhodococcus baikonurensis]
MTGQLFGDDADSALTVGAAASRLGVTVRTLHHWDAIGLVRPSGRSDGGYRQYTDADLGRIGRVLVYRDLGLSLDEIGYCSRRPQSTWMRSCVGSVPNCGNGSPTWRHWASPWIASSMPGSRACCCRRRTGLDLRRHWQPSWGTEAHERWGDSAQWAQHAERSAGRTAEDWQKIADGVETLNDDLASACRSGVEPGSDEANSLAERHRASIGVYFDCTHPMQVCLGRMYVADPGFSEFFDQVETGLAAWIHAVIDANALAMELSPNRRRGCE